MVGISVRRRTMWRLDATSAERLGPVFDEIRGQSGATESFPETAIAEAEAAAQHPPSGEAGRADMTDLEFWTVDPQGSLDLDQALWLSERDGGYRVRYAIADVAAVVRPGGALDTEARHRGQTLYAPDGSVPLHPRVLSEGSASLLPGHRRAALVWTLDLDQRGDVVAVELVRAWVRSRERLEYAHVQARVDDDPRFSLLRRVGEARLALEIERGGASLPLPDQEVVATNGGFGLVRRPALPAEDWNAQVSLMTGMAAADLMLAEGVGILRTLPAPDPTVLQRFRRQARALDVAWPAEVPFGELIRGLDPDDGRHLALLHEATSLFRGAGYTAFDGAPPELAVHAAVAAPYAHVTAPLRRLVDRFGLEICVSVSSGADVPAWVRSALPELPGVMAASQTRAAAVERGCTEAVEAAVLSGRVGETFEAVVVQAADDGGLVQVLDPAVLARCDGDVRAGERIVVTLVDADVAAGKVRFAAQTRERPQSA